MKSKTLEAAILLSGTSRVRFTSVDEPDQTVLPSKEMDEMEGGVALYLSGMLGKPTVSGTSKEPREIFSSKAPEPEGTGTVPERRGAAMPMELDEDGMRIE